MKSQNFIILSLAMLLTILSGCEKENSALVGDDTQTLSPEVLALKNNLESNYGEDPFPYYHDLENMGSKSGKSDADRVELDLEILWEEHTVRTEGENEAHEFRAVEKVLPIVGHELLETFTYTLMALKKEGETAYYLMKFSHLQGSDLQATFNQPLGFSGTIQVYDMDEELVSLIYMENGEIISKVNAADLGKGKTARSNCDAIRGGAPEANSIYDFESPTCNFGGGGRRERVRTDHYTDWYNYRGDGAWEYSHSTFEESTYEWITVPNGASAPEVFPRYLPEEYPGSSGPNHDPADFYDWFYEQREMVEDKLITDTTDPCVNEILNRLQQKDLANLYVVPNIGQLSGTSHLSQGILDLFDKSGFYELVFKVAEAGYVDGRPRNAKTEKTEGKSEWTITLDDDYVRNATQLSIARTIIHESIHAFIGYWINSNRTSPLADYLNDYRLELLLNSDNSYSPGELENLSEHNFISQFVDAMANSLAVWDNRRQDMEYYKKLSWAGLETSSAYQAQSNKTEIQTAILNENNGNNKAKGTRCPR